MTALFDLVPPVATETDAVPQFHNTFPQSSDAMASILPMHFPTGTILDVNFGLGVFYSKVNRDVTGIDCAPAG